MGYVRTIAHHTASAARHAGDRVWIRNGNGSLARPFRPGMSLHGLGFVEAIPALVGALAAIGTAGYQVYAADQDKKDAQKQASKAAKQAAADAAAAAAEQKRVDDAMLKQSQAQSDATVASKVKTTKTLNVWVPVGIGGGLLLLGGLVFWRMRAGKKR